MRKNFEPSMESLLRQREEDNKLSNPSVVEKLDVVERAVSTYQADTGADLEKLMDMIGKVVTKSKMGKKDKVKFVPDEGNRVFADPGFKVDHPFIFFEVIESCPDKEIKPRVRREFIERNDDDKDRKHGMVYGQAFNAVVQFNIFACDYLEANKVMKSLEELLFSYTSYFKQNGISELIFQRRLTDRNLDMFRMNCSVRSLQYFVRYERNYAVYAQEIAGIELE